ncbi:unnamed protein product [Microthlaspi erraticum]|uniref:Uncharacterized protein n=1 Tax=Microthlaspi erraticum TaxID=1685480 RepID=A0A6D2I4X7_9BRAS|nr:unnamed protein product [Microthlaspi erraticum]
MGQVPDLPNQVSTHFRWNTCPQPGSPRHHCPILNLSRQTTQSPLRRVMGSENLNRGRFSTNEEDNGPDGWRRGLGLWGLGSWGLGLWGLGCWGLGLLGWRRIKGRMMTRRR